MKKKITYSRALMIALCIIFFCNCQMFAQNYTYKPMALEGAHWYVGLYDGNLPPWANIDYYQYVTRGDTILNDINYKKVFFRDVTDVNPYLITCEYLAGLIRDDTANRKVYAIDFNFPYLVDYFAICPKYEEFLLYDFSITIGDTLDLCIWGGQEADVINTSIEYYYGQERKLIWANGLETFLIEGIGSDFGVFEWGMGSKGWSFLLDYYCLGTDEECGCQWVGLEERQQIPAFKVFPNPVTGNTITLMHQIPVSGAVEVRLFDMTGKEIYRQVSDRLTENFTLQIPEFRLAPSSPVLLWVGNCQSTLYKQLVIRQ